MKTLFGVTYAQLNNLSAQELNEYQAAWTMNEVRKTLPEGKMPEKVKERFLAITLQKTIALMNEMMTEDFWAKTRSLYGSEERFNMAVDIMDLVQSAPAKMSVVMKEVVEQLEVEFGKP